MYKAVSVMYSGKKISTQQRRKKREKPVRIEVVFQNYGSGRANTIKIFSRRSQGKGRGRIKYALSMALSADLQFFSASN
jgi:hypothetical protein